MIVNQPDVDLGRCPNFRTQLDAYGYPKNVRCVDRTGHTERCRFPKPPKRIESGVGQTYQAPEPRQWVPPAEDDERYER